jgi:hypothetical protein
MYQVEIPKRDDEISLLRKRVAELESENLRLREEVTQKRVVCLSVNEKARANNSKAS